MTRVVSGFALACMLASCRHFQSDADRLYEGEPRPPAEVAKLAGPIAKVDGVDVSELGPIFALLPGCHIVQLRSKIGEGTATGAWSEEIGRVIYAFPMRAGYLYVVDAELQAGGSASSVGNAGIGGVKLRAVEEDADGKVVAKFSKVRSKADVEKCREADASLRPKPEEARAQADASIAAPAVAASRLAVDGGSEAGP